MRGPLQALRVIFERNPEQLITPLAVFALVVGIGYLCRRFLLHALAAWNSKSTSRTGLILAESLRGPMLIWILILAVHLAFQSSDLPARFTQWSK